MASLSCATIAAHSRRCRVAEISLLFVRTTATLCSPQNSLLATVSSRAHNQIANAQRDLVFQRAPRRWLWLNLDVCERYREGCRETVPGDFCFDFCDPMRGFAGPARVARGSRRCHQAIQTWPHTPHMESSMHGIRTKRVHQLWSSGPPTMAASNSQS